MSKENSNKSILVRLPYDNYRIFHPDNSLMCFCSHKKANWYIKRNLAKYINEFDIQLLFEPKGYGDPEEILISRTNKCVISGSNNNLTKHHIIPSQYRQHFDIKYKDKNSSDLVVLSRHEHDKYEQKATIFKNKLFNDFIDEHIIEKNNALIEAKAKYNCIKKYFKYIPDKEQVYILMRFDGLIEKWGFTEKDLNEKYNTVKNNFLNINCNKLIVEKIGSINLIILWKLHFIKYGQPKYMPNWWKYNIVKIIHTGYKKRKTELLEIDINKDYKLKKLIKKYNLL